MNTKTFKVSCCTLLGLLCVNHASAESITELSSKLKKQELRIEELENSLKNSSNSSYNKGFSINDTSNEETPYSLKINGRMQFRYTGFDRRNKSYTFDNGKTGTQSNRNEFEIERGRLEFSGFVADPNLQYYLNLDFDTDDNHDAKAHDFWFNYVFSKAFNLYAGKAFVPGSREWIDGSTTTHLADRSLATSFFRPDRSLGIWAIGEAVPGLNYRFMVANGFNTTDLKSGQVDDKFTYALSLWGNLTGDYGKGRADLENHQDLAIRVGASGTYSPITASPDNKPLGEADSIRLSDGTKLDAEGALGDGITVSAYDLFLYAVDFGLKYQGFSINSEVYFREINSIKANAALGDTSFSDNGMYVDTGYFIVPESIEGVLRYSYINGDALDSSEYAGGINYYINGTHKNKLTFDVSILDDSPVSSSGPNYLVGATGTMYRLQYQVAF